MVIDSHGDNLFSHLLSDNVLIQEILYLGRFKKVYGIKFDIFLIPEFFVHYVVSLIDTVIADKSFEAGNKHIGLFLGSAAK
jgi:hypothetical protein